MRKIVKSSFPICSFTNTPQSYVLFYNLQNFSQKITQKFTNHARLFHLKKSCASEKPVIL